MAAINAKNTNDKLLNILLLGETGVGKSTWINGFINYLSYSDLDEAERQVGIALIQSTFSVEDSRRQIRVVTTGSDPNEEQATGESSTQMPQTYVFAGRNLTVKLIDTPGIGDTRGVEKDRENVQFILNHIAMFKDLHAICILLKPNNARLNVMFTFVVRELVTHLHKSACQNIVFCFTNSRGTFYRPGDTLPALRKLLENDKNIEIPLNRETIYCTDNEAMRYLYAVQRGVSLEPDEKTACAGSFVKSATELERWLRHVAGLKPHPVLQTLSLNDARLMIVMLQRPLAEISDNIQRNIAVRHDEEERLFEMKSSGKAIPRQIRVPRIVTETLRLDQPRIVCTRCNPGAADRNVPDCRSVKKTFFGKVSAAFGHPKVCKQCRCPPSAHMEMMYEILQVEIMETIDAPSDCAEQEGDEANRAAQAFIKTLEEEVRNLREEQKQVISASAQFACFLRRNSIAAYNDALDDYFERIIVVAREDTKGNNRRRMEDLEAVRHKYREETKALNDALDDPRAKVNPPTSVEIQQLIDKIMQMKHTGPLLNEIARFAAEAEKQARQHAEIVVDVTPKGAHPNSLQVLFNGGV